MKIVSITIEKVINLTPADIGISITPQAIRVVATGFTRIFVYTHGQVVKKCIHMSPRLR